jgi:hypothetical protein
MAIRDSILEGMISGLTAFSLYRQLEGLEDALSQVRGDAMREFGTAKMNQQSFNHILKQLRDECAEDPEYVRSFAHIERADIPGGADRSVYPRFYAQVKMLRQAVGALLEMLLPPEQKKQIGFPK